MSFAFADIENQNEGLIVFRWLGDVGWMLLSATLAMIALGPSWWIVSLAHDSVMGATLAPVAFVFGIFAFVIFFSMLVAMTIRFVFPPLVPGTHAERDRRAVAWALQSGLYFSLVPTFLQFVNFFSLLRYPFYRIMGMKLASNVRIAPRAMLYDPSLITIESQAMLGESALVTCHLHLGRGMLLIAPVRIGKNALVSSRAGILPGVTIGENSIVQVNSFVTPNTVIPPNELWGGNPAHKIKDLPIESGSDTPGTLDGARS